MKNNMLKNLALLFAVIIALSSCASTKVPKDPHAQYLGNWNYVVDDLPVDIDGTMIITKEEGDLNATMANPMGEMLIEDVSIVDGVFKAEFEVEGNFIELEGTFEGNTYTGALFVQGGEFPMKMTKQEE
jgi:hypothetical protein